MGRSQSRAYHRPGLAMPARFVPFLLFALVVIAGCSSGNGDQTGNSAGSTDASAEVGPAQLAIDRAIAAHGGDIIDNSRITFDFRGFEFVLERENGRFQYERRFTGEDGTRVREGLNNDGFFRDVNGQAVELDSLDRRRIGDNVNSMAYFTLLPVNLNDPAVIKEYMGEVTIKGAPYHKIGITYRQEGGGRDYQDRFLVWIHADNHTMDYYAYWYFTDETGSRFRSMDVIHEVGGARLRDELNWTYDDLTVETIDRYDELFDADSLRLVSEIRLENITVTPY